MPKKKSPEITVFMPPSEECPQVSARRIKTCDLDDDCARVIVEEILAEKLGTIEWTIDFFTTPVTLEIKRKGSKTKTFTWDPSEFSCLREFLDDLRSRLPEFDIVKLREDIQVDLENILRQVRDACIRETVETVEIDRVPSEADLAIEGIRDSLGLTQLRQPSRRLANLRQVDLRRVPRDQRHPNRLARLISKIPELLEVIL